MVKQATILTSYIGTFIIIMCITFVIMFFHIHIPNDEVGGARNRNLKVPTIKYDNKLLKYIPHSIPIG